MQRHPAPHGPGLVLFALAVGGFAIGITEFATMSLLPYFAAGLGIDAPTAGHVISAYALGVVIGAPLIAVVGARLARRTMLVLLMGGFAAANGLSALAPSYEWMLLFRFLSGVPHGAYFGYAALVATSLVPVERRTQAVGRIFLGLTFATVVGVPLANWLGQALGWRWSFVLVALSGISTALLIWRYAPLCPADPRASPLRELGALRRGQVWLTLLTGAIGFGGLFTAPHVVPLVLSVMGLGMTLGNLLVPRLADRALMPTAAGLLLWSVVVLALYPFTANHLWLLMADVFAIGIGGALGTVLQTRLMDVAADAQGLAASLNHSAFNTANALGPYLGGLAIAAGYGWSSPGWVGSLLAAGGLVLCLLSMWLERQHGTAALQSFGS
jgi:DHA1 family inner membrane transport protein